ncbi:MAG: TIGR03564 family F420-dependent LLM class oxidoreductase [Ilumatobacteraceae bacterium]
MKIGIFSSTANGTIHDIIGEATQVERDGFASYWMSQIFSHDALTVLALIGQQVPRIELGTSVVPTYPRHPMMLAQQSHTVNAAVDGRLCLGIGLSHKVVIEGMMGMSFDKPVRHLREYLSILGPLSKTQKVSFAGEVYTAHAELAIAGAKPFGIVVAALGTQMLRVTAAMADGTLTWCTGPETLASHIVPTIRAAAEEFGRPTPRVIAALPVCVTNDVAAARERAAKVFAMYGQLPSYRAMLDREGAVGPADIAIFGTTSEVVDRISALGAIDVTDFAAVEFGATPDEVANTRAALTSLL